MQKQPIKPGFVCPSTGRVNGDAPAYWYSAQAEEWGLDPWRLVEGVDPHTQGESMDVCFADGSTKTVGPLMTFFLAAADAARLENNPDFSR